MKLIRNAGTDRVLDLIEPQLVPGHRLDLLTPTVSIFAFEAIRKGASLLAGARFVLPSEKVDLALQGSEQDRAARSRLQAPHLAKLFAEWLRAKCEFRHAPGAIPQGLAVVRGQDGEPLQAVHGSFGADWDKPSPQELLAIAALRGGR